MDRLSDLHESLLIHILSSLNMRDAVKTSLLVKHFRNLSTQVYNLVFDFPPFDRTLNLSCKEEMELTMSQNQKYESFVDHALMQQCNAPNINKFCLRSCLSDKETIDKWVSFVLAKNVKFLELSIYTTPPDCLLKTSSKLTTLFLGNMRVADESIEKILMNCPLLETLILRGVCKLNHLNIMSPTVKLLELYDIEYDAYYRMDKKGLEVRAPSIRELVISERFLIRRCQLVDVSSLVKATVTFTTNVVTLDTWKENSRLQLYNNEWFQMVNELLKSLHHVRELVIGSEIIQVLTLWKLTNKPTPKFTCKKLSLETRFWKFDILGIACLLENSPDLEMLFIKVLGDWEDSCPIYQTLESFTKSDGPNLDMLNRRNLVNLKNVKIVYWRYPCRDTAEDIRVQFFDFELVEFILKGAIALDKLVLCSSNSSCHCCKPGLPDCSPFHYVTCLSSKLRTTILVRNEAPQWGEPRNSENKIEFFFYKSLFPKDRDPKDMLGLTERLL